MNGNILISIKELKSIEKFEISDILCILHLSDTDGCFINDDSILIDDTLDVGTKYDVNNIIVKSIKQKSEIVLRNKKKRNNKKIMMSKIKFKINKREIDYQLFYYSRCLEHVLFDEANPNKKTKIKKIERFVDKLTNEIEDFLENHMCELTKDTYKEMHIESWDHIQKGTNSLKRSTNVPLLFKYLNDKCTDSE